MTPKLIKTRQEHAAALNRIEQLWDAKPGTPQADEFELLVHLVDQFESQHDPIDLPDPIQAIRFRMEQAGLKQKDLEPYIGSKGKVSEVLSGKRELSLAMIRRLHQGLGIPAHVLLGQPGGTLPESVTTAVAKDFPILQMHKRGWFEGFQGSFSDLREQAEDLITAFLRPVGGAAAVPALNRVRCRKDGDVHAGSLQAWHIRVLSLASRQPLKPYTPGSLDDEFLSDVAKLSEFDDGPLLVRELLSKRGIHLIIQPHLPKTHLDGAAIATRDGARIIGLTLRHDRLDNFWFTLLHELAHIKLHLDTSDTLQAIFDNELDAASTDRFEVQADTLARDTLIPPKLWKPAALGDKPSTAAVKQFARTLRIHPAIVAGRVQFHTRNFAHLSHLVGRGTVRKLFPEADGAD